MNKISTEERVGVVACLVEGNSLRATTRMTGVHRTTVMKLLADLGSLLQVSGRHFSQLELQARTVRRDWSFVGCKEKNLAEHERKQGRGDVWTWTAIDAETKLVPC